MMRALDFTLNSVTMLALVLMVGVVIDDAIVVLENIFRFVEEKKMRPFEAARAATAEIGLAVMATTLSLVVIFIPVSFMSSISGRFLYQFGITAAVAVMVSLLVSFTLTPMMSARLLRAEDAGASAHDSAKSRSGFYGWIDRSYTRILTFALGHRLAVALVAASTVAAPTSTVHRTVTRQVHCCPYLILFRERRENWSIAACNSSVLPKNTEHFHTCVVDLNRDLAIRSRPKTVPGPSRFISSALTANAKELKCLDILSAI